MKKFMSMLRRLFKIRSRDEEPSLYPQVFYVCDRRACPKCLKECSFTTELEHAANFEKTSFGDYFEKTEG